MNNIKKCSFMVVRILDSLRIYHGLHSDKSRHKAEQRGVKSPRLQDVNLRLIGAHVIKHEKQLFI